MRLFYYLLVVVGIAVVAMYFVSQGSRHVRIGYELTRLRQERTALQESARKLDFEILKAAEIEKLEQAAAHLGLSLEKPGSEAGPPRR